MRLTHSQLRRLIREELETSWDGDEDPRPTPTEPNFVNGPDTYSGYILVSDSTTGRRLAAAPIYVTDGPDRPYLVRTTDTHWYVPHEEVRVMYPEIEEVFNAIDSKFDWRTLGPGDSDQMGGLTWSWKGTASASKSYVAEKEAPKRRFEAELVRLVKQRMPASKDDYSSMIETALDAAGVTDPSLRSLISMPFKMIPPEFLLKM